MVISRGVTQVLHSNKLEGDINVFEGVHQLKDSDLERRRRNRFVALDRRHIGARSDCCGWRTQNLVLQRGDLDYHEHQLELASVEKSDICASGPGPIRARLADDRGDSLATMVTFTMTVVIFFFAAHLMQVYHGRSVLSAAAQDGLAAAQLEDGTESDGQAAISQTLALSTNVQLVGSPSVSINGANSEVQVQISGRVTSGLLPFANSFDISIRGPKERFYGEDERP